MSGSYFSSFLNRGEEVSHLSQTEHPFDLLIIGGGIHGASLARLASYNGLRVALLEAQDYASGTSSRSSKMAHGGLRYLELFDFKQVFEGIQAREELYQVAPHLVYPYPFSIPVFEGEPFFRIKLKLGLWLYDRFARCPIRKSFWTTAPKAKESFTSLFARRVNGWFTYYDGILDDIRIVQENILSARMFGAHCLNYAQCEQVLPESDYTVVSWKDTLRNTEHTSRAKVVVNCAGPWVPFAAQPSPASFAPQIRYSRGVHLLFDVPWDGPALFLPLDGRARYYFVWPHFAGTLVGTTEAPTDDVDWDPQPTGEEIHEVLTRLERDLPHTALTQKSLSYAFAGIRTLFLQKKDSPLSEVSRRHQWIWDNGMLSLIGGKFTTSALTAEDGFRIIQNTLGAQAPARSLCGVCYPGAENLQEHVRRFEARCKEYRIAQHVCDETIRRLGARVQHFEEDRALYELATPGLLRGEAEMIFRVDQCEVVEDLFRRRLQLEFFPSHKRAPDEISFDLFSEYRTLEPSQRASYVRRIADLREVLVGGEY